MFLLSSNYWWLLLHLPRWITTTFSSTLKSEHFSKKEVHCSLRKTESFEEQIMSKDKYPSIFLRQMETIVFIILQIFFTARAVSKIGEYSQIFASFRRGIFSHVTRLNQSHASENIWWIINWNILIWLFRVSNIKKSSGTVNWDFICLNEFNNTC